MGRNLLAIMKQAAFAVILSMTLQAALAQSSGSVELLAEGVAVFRHGAHRSLFLYSDEGVIVAGPINAEVARSYRQAIATVTDQPVRFVVYSHYHWDRVSGAEVFTREGAKVVA